MAGQAGEVGLIGVNAVRLGDAPAVMVKFRTRLARWWSKCRSAPKLDQNHFFCVGVR